MNNYVLRYSEDLRVELPSSDFISVIEEVKDSYTGLVNASGLRIYRVKEQMGFQFRRKTNVIKS